MMTNMMGDVMMMGGVMMDGVMMMGGVMMIVMMIPSKRSSSMVNN